MMELDAEAAELDTEDPLRGRVSIDATTTSGTMSPSSRSVLTGRGSAEAALAAVNTPPEPIVIETEMLDAEEFDFLDRGTRLAELQVEFDDTRAALSRQRNNGVYVPLRLYGRNRGSSVISVTDVTSGLWCEVKVEYRHLHPVMRRTSNWKRLEEKGAPVMLRTPVMKEGTSMHLKKELEVHVPVVVKTETAEDRQVVRLIDTYTQLAAVKSGALEREIAVFGDPIGSGVVLNGVIDQLQYSAETGELALLDYKTRVNRTFPSAEQKRGNSLQLMLYKSLLDGFTTGMTTFDLLKTHMGLSFETELSSGPREHLLRCGLGSLLPSSIQASDEGQERTVVFGELVRSVSELIVGLGLPLVSSLTLHYQHQASGEDIGVESVDYDEDLMRQLLESSMRFWKGERRASGVDVEDAWKCGMCQFKDVCVWKLQRELEQSPASWKPPI